MASQREQSFKRHLGRNQAGCLQSLLEHGGWQEGCGWIWDTTQGTKRILNTLVKAGRVECSKGFYTIKHIPADTDLERMRFGLERVVWCLENCHPDEAKTIARNYWAGSDYLMTGVERHRAAPYLDRYLRLED